MRNGQGVAASMMRRQVAARGASVRDWECDYVFADGTVRHMVASAEPLRERDGTAGGSVGAFLDITDRKRAEESLRDADRNKNQFLAVLSHELRNPLAPIRNALYILDHANEASVEAQHAREVVRRQFAHLGRLVDDGNLPAVRAEINGAAAAGELPVGRGSRSQKAQRGKDDQESLHRVTLPRTAAEWR